MGDGHTVSARAHKQAAAVALGLRVKYGKGLGGGGALKSSKTAILYAILAAVFYGISAPVSKLLLAKLHPTFMAALLYLGAGLGMLVVKGIQRSRKNEQKEARITRKDWPFVVGMILLDIAAPILLMLGLTLSNPATVSLLNNFEIAATAMIALIVFREAIGKRMWIAIALITASSILLSVDGIRNVHFSPGAVLALLACVCWGFENNCTRMLSLKDPLQIVIIKGLGAGAGALLIAAAVKSLSFDLAYTALALLLGFVAYGLSIAFYIRAQRTLGAARTSAYYAIAPFIGVALSFAVGRQRVTIVFVVALLVMLLGAYFAAAEKHAHSHKHAFVEHEHRHSHDDGHHTHVHDPLVADEHSHLHTHEENTHSHAHSPDLHHAHTH